MEDHSKLLGENNKHLVVFVEFKKPNTGVNKTWTDPNEKNIERMLQAVGVYPIKEIEKVAKSIYETGSYNKKDEQFQTSILYFSRKHKNSPSPIFSKSLQITFDEALEFIFDRFKKYEEQKKQYAQWRDTFGEVLWKAFKDKKLDEFKKIISEKLK